MQQIGDNEEEHRFLGLGSSDLLICFVLICVTLGVYLQVQHFDFVYYDDQTNVARNPHVHGGLTAAGIKWAFSSTELANWFPVTRLSQLADFQFFGDKAGMHHLTNVLLHVVASICLFAFFLRATVDRWASAFVAFVFALHPLHVESVAWVAERKDVLCALFWFLTLLAWLRYTERPAAGRYLAALLLFALGLMSKPMIVTLPFLLLVVDFWPLGRTFSWRLILEKIPFAVLAAAEAVVTYYAQRHSGAVKSLAGFPPGLRIENALITYVVYVGKAFLPTHLAVFYPYPASLPVWQAAAAAVLLAAVSFAALRTKRTHPWLLAGWLWYLGTLVPVIGLVQAGLQARADRYMYVPMVGLTVMLAWEASDLVRAKSGTEPFVRYVAAIACIALAATTWVQLGHWKSSEPLFRQAIDVTSDNYLAYMDLGAFLCLAPGRLEDATEALESAVRIKPDSAEAHTDLGAALRMSGRPERASEAIRQFQAAIRIDPGDVAAHANLAAAWFDLGLFADAAAEAEAAIRIAPETTQAQLVLGSSLLRLHSRVSEAIPHFEAALRLNPGSSVTLNELGAALANTPGRMPEAIARFEEAVRLDPGNAEAHYNLAIALAGTPGRRSEAIAHPPRPGVAAEAG